MSNDSVEKQWEIYTEKMTAANDCSIERKNGYFVGTIEWQPVNDSEELCWAGSVQEHEEVLGIAPVSEGFEMYISVNDIRRAERIVELAARELDAIAYPRMNI